MGVQNLWMLLAPVGRQIEIETLASNVLAVDASIWLTQFIKAMRDDEGNMIKNAHLIGTFHRVAKLLFYRIRPVFVFDGNTPEIKKRTVARRRRRQENQAANLKQTAQRILLNRLKLYREELKKNGGKPAENSAVAPNFILPSVASTNVASESKEENVITIDDSDEEKGTGVDAAGERMHGETGMEERKSEGDGQSDDEELTADDIVLDASRLTRVDLDAVFALPGHLQKDMIARIQRDHRQEAREKFIPLAGNPEAYSRTQISSFLKTSQFNRQIMKARKKNAQAEMEKAAADVVAEVGGLHGNGQRIASSSERFFIYQNSQQARDSDEDSDGEARRRTQSELNEDEAANWELSGSVAAAVDAEDAEDIFERIHGSKRKRHFLDEDKVIVKKSLADFSVESVNEFSTEMSRAQRRKIAVEEARSKFLQKAQLKQQADSRAAESAHRDDATTTEDDQSGLRAKSITISFKEEELQSLDARAETLFPSSLFDAVEPLPGGPAAAQRDQDDEEADDIDWEDVPQSEAQSAVPTAKPIIREESDLREDLVAVSDVKSLPAERVYQKVVTTEPVSKSVIRLDEDSDEDVQWEDVPEQVPVASDVVQIPGDACPTTTPDSDEIDADAEAEPDADTKDLYASLQNELDDEKAEDDLAALRAEAIQSAIATASNLTQWAAGAVRRALAQHSRASDLSSVEAKRPDDQDVIDLSQAETADKEIPTSIAISDSAANVHNEAQDADDRLLQQAIKESIENAKQTASKDVPNRYLQYAPPDREPSVDVGAIVDEQRELKKLRNRQMRDTEGVNDEMVQDVMELLQLFGVPYLVCPMEAEAQCAALEQLGLVDGIITDDSDIFPFGGKKVYKNIFHNQKFVEAFFADDVKKELGFSQDEMIALAMLLGSDYTDGVRGIGIVNASEVVAAYPGVDGLKEFKQWVQTFDVAEEARRRVEKKKTQVEIDAMSPQERFEYTHASVRRKWELGDEFPNPRVVQAYKAPEVDRTDSRFSWELPNLAGLRDYCTQTFGWDQSKTDTVLLPLMEQIASSANERHRQTRIDQFFTKYDDNVKYAKIQSKRLRSAVEDKTGVSRSRASAAAPDTSSSSAKSSKMPTKKAQPTRSTKAKFTKTKKTTSTLGL